MNKGLFLIVSLVLCIYACDKGHVSDDTAPRLSYQSATLKYKVSSLDSNMKVCYCTVRLSFEDSSGDIGWSDAEKDTYFPTAPLVPQLSYMYSDTSEVYPVLNKSYIQLQSEYYSQYFPQEEYTPFSEYYDYPTLMAKYYQLMDVYERIMQQEYYSLMVEYYEGDKVKTRRDDVNYNSVLPPLGGYVPTGSVARGDIVYDINLSERRNDTVSFSFILRDRQKNTSERVYTPIFVIRGE